MWHKSFLRPPALHMFPMLAKHYSNKNSHTFPGTSRFSFLWNSCLDRCIALAKLETSKLLLCLGLTIARQPDTWNFHSWPPPPVRTYNYCYQLWAVFWEAINIIKNKNNNSTFRFLCCFLSPNLFSWLSTSICGCSGTVLLPAGVKQVNLWGGFRYHNLGGGVPQFLLKVQASIG